MRFNSHTDIVVSRAVALINAATTGHRRGKPYTAPAGPERIEAILTALSDARHSRQQLSEDEATALENTAAQLRVVFDSVASGDVDSAANTLNKVLTATSARPLLERHDGEPWHIHFHASQNTYAVNMAASCATGLAVVLGSEFHDRLGVCTAAQCDRVYVDTSRNGTRRFCSTSCQNRVKTAAFRARSQHSKAD